MSVSWLVRPIQETLLARQGAAALSGLSSGEEALLILYYVSCATSVYYISRKSKLTSNTHIATEYIIMTSHTHIDLIQSIRIFENINFKINVK